MYGLSSARLCYRHSFTDGSDWELPRGQVQRALTMKKGDGCQLSALNSQKIPSSLNTEVRRGVSTCIL